MVSRFKLSKTLDTFRGQKPGIGNGARDWGVESRGAGSQCGNQLSAIHQPLSDFAYRFL